MAYKNKTGNTTDINQTEDVVVVNEVADNENDKIAQLTNTVEALKAQNELLMKMFVELKGNTTIPTQTQVQPGEIKLIHLVQCAPGLSTHIELSNTTIDMNAFGEERTLDLRQAEELAGKYRRFFEKGLIAFGAGSEEFAKRFALKTTKDYSYYNKDFVKHLGMLSYSDLENLYNKLAEGHKKFVIEYFQRKIIEGDPNFKNVHKIEILNRLSNGAMSGTALDLSREAETAAQKN